MTSLLDRLDALKELATVSTLHVSTISVRTLVSNAQCDAHEGPHARVFAQRDADYLNALIASHPALAKRLRAAEAATEALFKLGVMRVNGIGSKLDRAAEINAAQNLVDEWRTAVKESEGE